MHQPHLAEIDVNINVDAYVSISIYVSMRKYPNHDYPTNPYIEELQESTARVHPYNHPAISSLQSAL
jgi:hypothetical protein